MEDEGLSLPHDIEWDREKVYFRKDLGGYVKKDKMRGN
jgi:hypothetical protein